MGWQNVAPDLGAQLPGATEAEGALHGTPPWRPAFPVFVLPQTVLNTG